MIYVLRAQNQKKGFFKVGFSGKPERRISDIQTNCPFKLSLVAIRPGTLKEERAFHKHLKDYKTNGEWFKDTPETRDILKITYVHQELKKDWTNQTDWYKVATFILCNKEYSYSAEMLFDCLGVDPRMIDKFYHSKRFDSPFRLEAVSEEDAAKVNLVGKLRESHRVISHPDLFTPILGDYDKFWVGPTRITPFNQHFYPGKPLGSTTWR